jgi:predicted DNA-binding transcriptional regulator AlpA
MARHTRRLPRNRQERARAKERAARQLEHLEQDAREVRELEAAARAARAKLQKQILRHIEDRALDITEMAKTTGISRQTIHRLVRPRNPHSSPAPKWMIGQRVVHPDRGVGRIEKVDGPRISIRFDSSGERHELDAGFAGIKLL